MTGSTHKLSAFGRACFGLAIAAFGVTHLVRGDFATRMTPHPPGWTPQSSAMALWLGGALLGAGALIVAGKKGTRAAALLVGTILSLSLLVLYVPLVAARPGFGGAWTNPCKYLALWSGALLIAGLHSGSARNSAAIGLDRLARTVLGGFFVLGGVQHFVYSAFVATLVPAWIPWHLFWACFAGIALIAAGIGLQVPRTARLAALLAGSMIFTWFLILHIPRAAATGDPGEWSGVFESLAMAGLAFMLTERPDRPARA